ncbi:hypothetical protein RUM44_010422 [Polyplax serrata]|uniref:ZP domain-containing protein n=1 Tax=Polyplax serrata TaxID=468196 RepID=A0ABR1AVG2_POLSC
MRVKSCAASDGAGHVIQLSDENGCVLRPKMISRFLKAKGADERASVITYAFFHAFKFPDALSVHIKCKVEICRHGCLDHCQFGSDFGHLIHHPSGPGALHFEETIERKDSLPPPPSGPPMKQNHQAQPQLQSQSQPSVKPIHEENEQSDDLYDDLLDEQPNQVPHHRDPDFSSIGRDPSSLTGPSHQHVYLDQDEEEEETKGDPLPQPQYQEMPRPSHRNEHERFPHGPRNLNGDDIPIIDSRSLSDKDKRKRRSVVVSDRKVRSADVGVSGIYEVISEADLAFTPDTKAEAVTVFRGRIREEVVYGICLPMPGFSVLFVLVAVSAVVAALVAGSLLYRYQLQKEAQRLAQQRRRVDQRNGAAAPNGWANWMAMRLLRARVQSPCVQNSGTSTQNHSHDG